MMLQTSSNLLAFLNAMRDINYIENKGFEGCFSFLHILPNLCSVINTHIVFSPD